MKAHSTEDRASLPVGSAVGDRRMPPALWSVVAGMILGALLLIALPVVMMIDRAGTYEAIRNDQPHLDPSNMEFAFYGVIAFAVVIHAVDVVLTIWFGVKAVRGKQWARIALTTYLVVATVGSVFSAMAVPNYLWVVIPSDGIHVVLLTVLWVPRSVREFYAVHRCATTVP